jgi:peptidoglycan/LPS O-acetylase OafA/YrhL
MSTAAAIRTRERLFEHCPEIDSLRAIAMIAVVAMHSKLLPFGWAGVWLFFVISGYVVTLSIARQQDPRMARRHLIGFFRRRTTRIVPVYYLYILLGLAVSLSLGISQRSGALFSLFGFYQNLALSQGGGEIANWPTGHLWSISIEMQFYFVYGACAYFLSLRATKRLLWFFVIGAPVLRAIAGTALAGGDNEAIAFFIYSGTGLHFDSFAMGSLLALARLRTPIARLTGPLFRLGLGAMLLYVVSYLIINILLRERGGTDVARDVISGILYGEGREVFVYTALGLLSLAVLALTVAQHRSVMWFVGLKSLQWIGSISYGAYIYHALCLRVILWLLTGSWTGIGHASLAQKVIIFASALALTLIVAHLSYRFLERPIMKSFNSRKIRNASVPPSVDMGSDAETVEKLV